MWMFLAIFGRRWLTLSYFKRCWKVWKLFEVGTEREAERLRGRDGFKLSCETKSVVG